VRSGIQENRTRLPSTAIAAIRRALSDRYAGALVSLDGPISVRDNSEIFHAAIEVSEPIEAAVKHCLIPRSGTPDTSSAREQFVALERVASALAAANQRYRVPTPLCLIEDLATFAMSWLDGESLTQRMRRPATITCGARWLEGVGAWLGLFHNAGPCRRQRVDITERLAALEEISATPLRAKSFGKGIVLLRQTATPLKNLETYTSWLHGDCKADNFFLKGENIYGIDLSLIHENCVEYDLAQFLNNFDLLLLNPRYLAARTIRSKLENSFRRGYQRTGPTVSNAYLNWLRLSFALPYWHGTVHGRMRTPHSLLLNWMFANLTSRLSARIAGNPSVGSKYSPKPFV
jgi:tRNA A-37 threonylcarbamoyl transferase component Bud32